MATTALGDAPAQLVGELPAVGSTAPEFTLVAGDLTELSSSSLTGRTVLNIFPSIATGVCQASVRRFNELASSMDGARVLNVSVDLPFALAQFCGAEGLDDVTSGSAFRSSFGEDYGVRLTSSAFEGLLARAIVVLDADRTVLHTELVPQIGQEPDYDAALAALG